MIAMSKSPQNFHLSMVRTSLPARHGNPWRYGAKETLRR